MDLSIIIVNWNSKEYLRNALRSIVAGTGGIEYEIIVVDAASFDGCGEMLQQEFPQARFIQSRQNLGFARSNNMAFQSARGEHVLFLNPDTEIVGNAINVLHSALKSVVDAGAVGGRLVNTDRTVQTSCIQAFPTILNQLLSSEFLRRCFPRSRLWGMAALFESDTSPRVVEAISGACVMLPRKLLKQIGLFSEDYFMYAEDIDLSYKVRQAGFKCYYIPDATVVHHGGGCSQDANGSRSSVLMRESAWRYFRRTHGKCYGAAYRISVLFAALARLGLLVLLFLVQYARRQGASWSASFAKWKAILLWSVHKPGYDNDR